jgi:hypothetical protein
MRMCNWTAAGCITKCLAPSSQLQLAKSLTVQASIQNQSEVHVASLAMNDLHEFGGEAATLPQHARRIKLYPGSRGGVSVHALQKTMSRQ